MCSRSEASSLLPAQRLTVKTSFGLMPFQCGLDRVGVGEKMPNTIIEMDPTRKPQEQKFPIQNRWHPDIPIAAMVKPGDSFRVECLDWTGGQISNDDSAADVRDCNLLPCHHLS